MWDRLAAVYVAFAEARHAVTHRRAQATASGDLEIYDPNAHRVDTLSAAEIKAFTAAVHAAAELVIEAAHDRRRANIVAWHLNSLAARHNLSPLAAADPDVGRRLLLMDLVDLDDGRVRFDVARARQEIERQGPSLWDVRLCAGSRLFTGRWEDVPDPSAADLEFHPASPPPWLSEEAIPAE